MTWKLCRTWISPKAVSHERKPTTGYLHSYKKHFRFYGLPSIFSLISNPTSKSEWKSTLNHKIHVIVESSWKSDVTSKSSIKYASPDVLKVGSCHHIWSTVRNNIHDSKRTQLKCKLLTGTYLFQANRAALINMLWMQPANCASPHQRLVNIS